MDPREFVVLMRFVGNWGEVGKIQVFIMKLADIICYICCCYRYENFGKIIASVKKSSIIFAICLLIRWFFSIKS